MGKKIAVKSKKKIKRNIKDGKAVIVSSFNNTIITITDDKGDALSWASAGNCGFKGSRKGTPHAAQIASSKAAATAMEMGLENVDIYIKGIGAGRDAAARALKAAGLNVGTITDITPIPHNGCRPPKKRRV